MSLSLSRRLLAACRGRHEPNVEVNSPRVFRQPTKGATQQRTRMSMAGLIDCYGLTDIGRVRDRNEDQFLIADMTQPVAMLHSISSPGTESELQDMLNANLLLVADGVGGHAGGERASRLAMEGIVEYLHNNRILFADEERDEAQICAELKSALAWAQDRIRVEADQSSELARMGTTLTLAYLDWPKAFIAHCGDSRAYIYGGHELVQITHDQTITQLLVDAGAIDPKQVDRHPFRNALASLLSRDVSHFAPRVYSRRLVPGDRLLLCTDGLTKYLSGQEIAEILDNAYHAADACRELVVAANEAGGSDNVAVVLAHFGHRIATVTEEFAAAKGVSNVGRPGWNMPAPLTLGRRSLHQPASQS